MKTSSSSYHVLTELSFVAYLLVRHYACILLIVAVTFVFI